MKRSFAWWAAAIVGMIVLGCGSSTTVEEISATDQPSLDRTPPVSVSPGDWPWWRGPERNNVVASADVPTTWSNTENVLWQVPVPGRGHASPIVVADRIFLPTADEATKVQSVLCYDRKTGRQMWKTDVHRGGFSDTGHQKASQASGTLACDGERIFATFLNDGTIWATALDIEGRQVWQQPVGPFDPKFGYSPSPAIYKSLLIVAADHQSGGYLAALDRATGTIRWRKSRPAEPTYASPLITSAGGKDQLLIAGGKQITAYNPSTGELNWTTEGTTTSVAGTMTYDGDLVFASGGWPDQETVALRADTGKPVWRTKPAAYVPSLLAHQGCLYVIHDEGRAYCYRTKDGKELWHGRLPGSNISASPVLAGEHVYVPNEAGKMFVFKAGSEKLDLVVTNQLGTEAFATPVVAHDRLYLRLADHSSGTRQEYLCCIGKDLSASRE